MKHTNRQMKKWILAMSLALGMGYLPCVAFAVTFPTLQIETEAVTPARIGRLATGYCQGLNSAADQAACVAKLSNCVLGEGNRYGCELKDNVPEEYECESSGGVTFTAETMVEQCYEKPTPSFSIDASAVIAAHQLPSLNIPTSDGSRQTGTVDPDALREAGRNHLSNPLPFDVEDGRNAVTPEAERNDAATADDAPFDAASDEDFRPDGMGNGISGSGIGCSLSPVPRAYSLPVGTTHLLLFMGPLAWTLGRKKARF